ncbi:glycoside hydrolase family 28 protein [Hyaloscypha bicolor E]|uniref:endo-polygalacturonase n=1 Tax=Hyaloscypha bicolor E TaxID=1095630 RepID=A0A2J6TVJ0_9HELO|nr:glycoside hydrolase family 28 protein [Hyaloscypha bicolor E]PMD67042.1 glycoside hydrolase family 28 protein [Hyaloscypha bicolor E]
MSSSSGSGGGLTVASSPTTTCTCTAYSQIAPAVASCSAITLQDIAAPTDSSIDLSKLKANSVVTFAGKTTFAFTNSSGFNPMIFGGANVTITSAPGAIIDGNGQAYWDGQGSNGGVPKPDHFIVVSKMTAGSKIQNLHIQNWPSHLFSISGCSNTTMQNLFLDNSAGDAPNARSKGLPAAHNSDGFDLGSSSNFVITDSIVYNQDDCVAISSGNNVTVSNMYCSGGHGLSIGSVGGKSNNNVTNILFTNSQILNSQNGARIKSNFNTTGFISNITYSNIFVSNISIYGIDVQQDYLNGGPKGTPSNGVIISNLLFQNLTGTATASARDYYVLCGSGSCSNFMFTDVSITGGGMNSSCNYPASGCPVPY